MEKQHKIEKKGKFVDVPGAVASTKVFVPDGKDPEKIIKRHKAYREISRMM